MGRAAGGVAQSSAAAGAGATVAGGDRLGAAAHPSRRAAGLSYLQRLLPGPLRRPARLAARTGLVRASSRLAMAVAGSPLPTGPAGPAGERGADARPARSAACPPGARSNGLVYTPATGFLHPFEPRSALALAQPAGGVRHLPRCDSRLRPPHAGSDPCLPDAGADRESAALARVPCLWDRRRGASLLRDVHL